MLDRSRPHDQVFGISGVAFAQGGRMFNASGHPVTYSDGSDVVVAADPLPEPEKKQSSGDALEDMHWRHLKAMMEQYGEEYLSKDDAIAFIRGRRT